MSSAIGIVSAIVTMPHGDSARALTTTRPSTAIRMIMMPRIATSETLPAMGPISSRAIWPSDLPSRRTLAARITKSCTAPPTTTPIRIQSAPGR